MVPLRVPNTNPFGSHSLPSFMSRSTCRARDTGKLADWNDYLAGIDLEFKPAADHVIIDNSASSEPLQSQATKMLATITETA